jgi:hypothetical protein
MCAAIFAEKITVTSVFKKIANFSPKIHRGHNIKLLVLGIGKS